MNLSRQERLLSVIRQPRMSEKTTRIADVNRQVTFTVVKDASKREIKAAVELIYNVKVDKVNICKIPGKSKRFAQRLGYRPSEKKAYVSLCEGHDINFSVEVGGAK